MTDFIATALAVNEPVLAIHRIHRFLFPFRRARLKRNIRAWLPAALKNGPRSVEWEFVAEWSWTLRSTFGE
jgi:hypothetical protein